MTSKYFSPRSTRKLATLTFLCLLSLQSVVAQTGPGDWTNVQNLEIGSDICLKTKQGRKLQGRLDSVSGEKLSLWSSERDFPGRITVRREVPREYVKEIRMNHRAVSVVAGAAIGLGIGVAAGAIVDSQARSREDNGILGATLGLFGGLAGAAIGRTFPFIKGKRVYYVP